jgi:glycerol-3-phosphate dehydrogenase (NAD(P)+)
LKNSYDKLPVGVLGAGSFGAAVANVLARNRDVLLFTRRQEIADEIIRTGQVSGRKMNTRIKPTTDIKEIAESCILLFPVVRSAHFRDMMVNISPYLTPEHIIIHGTKGFDIKVPQGTIPENIEKLNRTQVLTMSEVILETSVVKRVGCFSGPNLAKELVDDQLGGTVIASRFEEVISEGQKALSGNRFKTYTNSDIIGVELAGALKNVMAIASGALTGLGFGENARAMLITRGLGEMIYLSKALGGNTEAFLGLAGVGDLIATCSSELSRNFSVGFRMAKGEKLNDILTSMNDVAEGVSTVPIVNALANYYGVRAPISQTLYKVLFKEMDINDGISFLMNYPITKDVAFL